ncbi:MAG TPA: oxalate/formate MFS antiporter [Gemmatimonadaceae bacterium]|jgi:OFA family oxalate/formate antiporter-like MFS transporter|nr:oxalate/formate MFS antiporter [Gemmatimonadaceae bacterium]
MTDTAKTEKGPAGGRWWQLIVGIICMSMIANLQYGWTLFVNPIADKHHWAKPAIQVAFTLFVIIETWLVPVEGWLVDKYGPRVVVLCASFLVAASWVLDAYADTLPMLYFAAAVGGIGAGAVYGTCVGNALKWFPDRRGLAAGLTAMGFGGGSALTVIPIVAMIKSSGYESTLINYGIGQGLTIFVLAWFLRAPGAGFMSALKPKIGVTATSVREYAPGEMLKTPVFWVMYVMFTLMATGGLLATAQLAPIAKDYGITDVPASILGLTLPALTFALSLDRVLNGVARPFFGWISDNIGRENTMFIAFVLEGAGILALNQFGRNPVAFVLLSALVFFAWGEIYSLFPVTCADTYGRKFATANAGFLYTAKGTAALLVPLSSVIAASGGGWRAVFLAAGTMNFVAAAMALVVLKPLRKKMKGRDDVAHAAVSPVPA